MKKPPLEDAQEHEEVEEPVEDPGGVVDEKGRGRGKGSDDEGPEYKVKIGRKGARSRSKGDDDQDEKTPPKTSKRKAEPEEESDEESEQEKRELRTRGKRKKYIDFLDEDYMWEEDMEEDKAVAEEEETKDESGKPKTESQKEEKQNSDEEDEDMIEDEITPRRKRALFRARTLSSAACLPPTSSDFDSEKLDDDDDDWSMKNKKIRKSLVKIVPYTKQERTLLSEFPRSDRWECVCSSLQDWQDLANSFQSSKYKCEKELYRTLINDFLPDLPLMFENKVRVSFLLYILV